MICMCMFEHKKIISGLYLIISFDISFEKKNCIWLVHIITHLAFKRLYAEEIFY